VLSLLIKQVYFQLNLLPLYRARVASSFTDYLIKKISDKSMNGLFAVRKSGWSCEQ